MPDYIPANEAALLVCFADHAAGVGTHGAGVGLSAADITQAADDAATVAHAINGRSLYESKKQEFTAYKDILLYAALNEPLPATPAPSAVGSLAIGCHAQAQRGHGAGDAIIARGPRYAPFVRPLPRRHAGASLRHGTHARQRAERIKSHPNYTTAIGEDCRIVAPQGPSAPTQATLKGAAQTDFAVKLTFNMSGHGIRTPHASAGPGPPLAWRVRTKRGAEADFTLLAMDTNSPNLDARPPLTPGQPEVRQYRARWRDDDQPFGDWSDIVQVTAKP